MLNIKYEKIAQKQLKQIAKDKKYLSKVQEIVSDIVLHPFEGIGKPEALKHELQGFWSRRIDKKNRLIYKVIEPDVVIISLIGHYA